MTISRVWLPWLSYSRAEAWFSTDQRRVSATRSRRGSSGPLDRIGHAPACGLMLDELV